MSAAAMKESLDTNRVNFLIWRYLLEGNYRETAAKFQKEWHVQEPHRHFKFAPHVRSHALVNVINDGLIYNGFERQFAHTQQVQRDGPEVADSRPQIGVFGPLAEQLAAKDDDEEIDGKSEDVDEDDGSQNRKRSLDRPQHALTNGSPAKRPRLSNGFENGADTATTPMEIDSHNAESNHAYPSPLERESAQTPVPRTDGPEQGTQIDKVAELAPETTFLSLLPDDLPASAIAAAAAAAPESAANANAGPATVPAPATTPAGSEAGALAGAGAETSASRANENPIVLHCEWNPRDPAILAAAGTDALARVWTLSRSTNPEPVSDHVTPVNKSFENLVDDEVSRSATVTAMGWNWDGTCIAIATHSESKARIGIFSQDGVQMHHVEVQEPPVIKLRWNPNNNTILTIAPDGGGTLVTVFSMSNADTLTHFLPNYDLSASEPLDAIWISETEFLLCGGDVLMSLRCNSDGITRERQFDCREDDNFVQVHFDWRSKLVATASDKGHIDLWDESGQRRTISAHIGPVTALQWQPLQSPPIDQERLLASGGEDGAISIWNARMPENKPKCSMTMDLPVVAVSFTPDGAFIAGATTDRILIWKVGENAVPRASWSRLPHPGWLSPKTNGYSDEEDQHCLGWDASGQKLVYGANNRLAVINFR